MERDERVSLEAALQVAKKLSAIEKLKLVKHLLVKLEAIIERREPKRRGLLQDPLQGSQQLIERTGWASDSLLVLPFLS